MSVSSAKKTHTQVRVIQQMVADLNVLIEIEVVPAMREPDGLAAQVPATGITPEQRKKTPGSAPGGRASAHMNILAGEVERKLSR